MPRVLPARDIETEAAGLVAAAHPLVLMGGGFTLGANQGVWVRVVVPRTGTLRDLSLFVHGQSGNISAAVYDTSSPWQRLYTTGAIACPSDNAWQILGDPQLPVTKGQHLYFGLSADNGTAAFGRAVQVFNTGAFNLPVGFLPGLGAGQKLVGIDNTMHPLPATVTDASPAGVAHLMAMIARVA